MKTLALAAVLVLAGPALAGPLGSEAAFGPPAAAVLTVTIQPAGGQPASFPIRAEVVTVPGFGTIRTGAWRGMGNVPGVGPVSYLYLCTANPPAGSGRWTHAAFMAPPAGGALSGYQQMSGSPFVLAGVTAGGLAHTVTE